MSHLAFFSYTLSALHRPRQNSAAGLAQAVHPKLLKGFFLSSLAKATSKLLFCLYWFSSLLKVAFYHSVTRCKEHFIELNICFFFSPFTLKSSFKNPTKPFKGKISEGQACLLVISRGYLSFCKVKAKHGVLVMSLL